LGDQAECLYLLGVFSCLDAILGRTLPDVLEELVVANHIKAALMGEEGLLGDIFKCTLDYENGNWEQVSMWAAKLRLDEVRLPQIYRAAVAKANEFSIIV
jgi:c-di-GMP-related signal transduction protein